MTFLFDTICDDLIEEITKYIVWTKHGRWNPSTPGGYWDGNATLAFPDNVEEDHRNVHIQRLLIFPLEKPIITLQAWGWMFSPEWNGPDLVQTSVHRASSFLQERGWHEARKVVLKNKIKTNKKGLITYTHQKTNYKQIDY